MEKNCFNCIYSSYHIILEERDLLGLEFKLCINNKSENYKEVVTNKCFCNNFKEKRK